MTSETIAPLTGEDCCAASTRLVIQSPSSSDILMPRPRLSHAVGQDLPQVYGKHTINQVATNERIRSARALRILKEENSIVRAYFTSFN